MQQLSFGIMGGDRRQTAIYESLRRDGYITYKFGTGENEMPLYEFLDLSDILVLPLPVTIDGLTLFAPFCEQKINLDKIFARIKTKTALGGKIPDNITALAKKYNVNLLDYLHNEQMTVRNVIPTVEGAIAIAIENTDFTIHSSTCAVLGFGRIGKVLAHHLKTLGANVSLFARRQSDLAWCDVWGYDKISPQTLETALSNVQLIFNTIPALILPEPILRTLSRDTTIIDLASAPGGVDKSAAMRHNITVISALSLPGKTAPKTAGEIIKDTILQMLKEEKSIDK